MGGGETRPAKKAEPKAVDQLAYMDMPAFMPGQQGLLADQLAAGYGQDAEAFQGLLSNLYQPMQLPIVANAADMEILAKQKPIPTAKRLGLTPEEIAAATAATPASKTQPSFTNPANDPRFNTGTRRWGSSGR